MTTERETGDSTSSAGGSCSLQEIGTRGGVTKGQDVYPGGGKNRGKFLRGDMYNISGIYPFFSVAFFPQREKSHIFQTACILPAKKAHLRPFAE